MTSEISTLTGDAPQALVFATKADAERRSGGAGPAEVRARGGGRGGQEWEGHVTRDLRDLSTAGWAREGRPNQPTPAAHRRQRTGRRPRGASPRSRDSPSTLARAGGADPRRRRAGDPAPFGSALPQGPGGGAGPRHAPEAHPEPCRALGSPGRAMDERPAVRAEVLADQEMIAPFA